MRGLVDRLPTPHPLGGFLPALYQEDPFAQGFVGGLDDVLAPVFLDLDSLWAYLDPWLAPEDFLGWLAQWVAADLDEDWPVASRRAVVARAVELFRMRGTVDGLRAHVETATGGTVTIVETGGVATSLVSGGDLPGEPQPRMTVQIAVDDPSGVDARALERLVASLKPAQVVHLVEVVAR